jgi:acyl-CoA dehydrogenase
MQTFGAKGLTQDTPLPDIWTMGRILQYADGPDEVHLRGIARAEIKATQARLAGNEAASASPAAE